MQNINNKNTLTMEYLKKKVREDNLMLNDDFKLDEFLAQEILNLIENVPEFKDFLAMRDFNEYELPTVVFEQLTFYINDCFCKKDMKGLEKVLDYLEQLILRGSDDINNLISVGFLESLVKNKKNFLETFNLMPSNLKKMCIKYHSHFSDGDSIC